MIRIAESDRRQVMLEVAVGDPAERGYYEGVDNRLESAVAYFASIGFTEARERGRERGGGRARERGEREGARGWEREGERRGRGDREEGEREGGEREGGLGREG